jgi:hypothetical protein
MTTPHLSQTTPINQDPLSPQALHAHFLAILPRIETHAQIHFHHIKCPGKRADAIAEVTAIAWKWFLRIKEQGKDIDEFVSAVATYAVKHVRSGRRLCGQEKAQDVLSPLAQKHKGFSVEPLPTSMLRGHEQFFGQPHGQDQMDALEERLQDDTRSPVPDQAAFRIDFPAWLSQLGSRNRPIAEDMALEHGTFDLADKHKMSPGRISQLRREFHKDWLRFHGEKC